MESKGCTSNVVITEEFPGAKKTFPPIPSGTFNAVLDLAKDFVKDQCSMKKST